MLDSLVKNLRTQSWVNAILNKANMYIVGGSVRDAFLKKPLKDVDLVVEGATLSDISHILADYGKLNIVGESFEVLKFRPARHIGEDYDIAVCRRDKKVGTGHKGFKVDTKNVTIIDDLERRDFTVNSIAVDIRTGKILDPFNGIKDIRDKHLRATSPNAFIEDALRILRAIQFAARFHFDIEPATLKLMKDNAHILKDISGERILGELDKILLKGGSTRLAFDLIERSDIDKVLFGKKFSKDGFEYFDKLDPVSFYYVLGNLGGVVPWQFYKNKLKGTEQMTTALMTLEKYFSKFDENKSEAENKWNVFLMLKSSSLIKDSVVLPEIVKNILKEMKDGKIPMKYGDIPVKGTDIMDKFGIPEGPELGNIINRMYQDALVNKFNWKSKEKTLKYLEKI